MNWMVSIVGRILLFFILAQLLGIYAGSVIIKDVHANPYVQSLVVTAEPDDPSNALFFFGYIILGAVVLVLLMRLVKIELVFRLIEIFLISSSSSIVFYAFLRFALGFEGSLAYGIMLGFLFAGAKFFLPKLKNAATIIAAAGVGVIFGISFGIVPTMMFLVLLALYDYAAVFVTKHMVEMADFLIKKDLSFTVTSRESVVMASGKKEEKRLDLGSGDMVAPIMFEVSLLPISPVATIFVFFGAVISLSLFMFLVWKKKMVLPALPPIVTGMLVFFFVGRLLGFY